MKSNREDKILDQVTAEIRNEKVDEATVSAAAERVWARVSAAAGEAESQLPAGQHVEGRIEVCVDFQALIPAYLAGKLSEARSLLLVDHTHECIPCRKAMSEARRPAVRTVSAKPSRFTMQPAMRWAIAAAVVIGIGLLAIPFAQRFWPFGEFDATVQAAEGQVYQIADTETTAVAAGAKLQKNEKVRTSKDGRAVVRLSDGTLIEMRDRSELYLTKSGTETTIHLNRGSIVVEAAKQNDGQLFVESADSLVSVTGTVFSVNNGTKGSRISVIEGEVWDVAVDIRRGSPTFGKWAAVVLSAENKRHFWIPEGFAHGFFALEDGSEFLYKVSNFYSPADERGIIWNDPDIGIKWPKMDYILSAKDQKYPSLKNAVTFP